MTNDPYNERVRDYFVDPQHVGKANGPIAYREDQGLRIRLSAEIEADTLKILRFLAWGCPHLIAATEAFCRLYEGKPATELERFSTAQIMRTLAVPVEKTGRILVLEDAVRSLGQAIRDRKDQ